MRRLWLNPSTCLSVGVIPHFDKARTRFKFDKTVLWSLAGLGTRCEPYEEVPVKARWALEPWPLGRFKFVMGKESFAIRSLFSTFVLPQMKRFGLRRAEVGKKGLSVIAVSGLSALVQVLERVKAEVFVFAFCRPELIKRVRWLMSLVQHERGKIAELRFTPSHLDLFFVFELRSQPLPKRLLSPSKVERKAVFEGREQTFPELEQCLKWAKRRLCQMWDGFEGVRIALNAPFDLGEHVCSFGWLEEGSGLGVCRMVDDAIKGVICAGGLWEKAKVMTLLACGADAFSLGEGVKAFMELARVSDSLGIAVLHPPYGGVVERGLVGVAFGWAEKNLEPTARLPKCGESIGLIEGVSLGQVDWAKLKACYAQASEYLRRGYSVFPVSWGGVLGSLALWALIADAGIEVKDVDVHLLTEPRLGAFLVLGKGGLARVRGDKRVVVKQEEEVLLNAELESLMGD